MKDADNFKYTRLVHGGWLWVTDDSGRTEFPRKFPFLSRACSLFLDRSSSLDGTLQGPGRGTKRYSQDSPPYSAPLSPKLPKNDRHPLEGEHSISSQSWLFRVTFNSYSIIGFLKPNQTMGSGNRFPVSSRSHCLILQRNVKEVLNPKLVTPSYVGWKESFLTPTMIIVRFDYPCFSFHCDINGQKTIQSFLVHLASKVSWPYHDYLLECVLQVISARGNLSSLIISMDWCRSSFTGIYFKEPSTDITNYTKQHA